MDSEKILRELADRQQITDRIYLYCRALDRCDEELLRSVFHPDSTHDHGPYKGPSTDFCRYAIDFLNSIEATQHHVGNILIELQGNVAYSEAYWVAYHRIPKGLVAEGIVSAHKAEIDEDLFIGGRYIDRFERRDGVWKIAHRNGVHDWQRWEAADERNFKSPESGRLGRRDRSDLAYWRG